MVYMAPVEAMSGKFAKGSDKLNNPREKNSYFVGNYWVKMNAKYFSLRNIVNPCVLDPTVSQIAIHTKFQSTIAAIKQKKANPTEWEAIKEGFKNQTKYRTLWNYAFAVIWPTIN